MPHIGYLHERKIETIKRRYALHPVRLDPDTTHQGGLGDLIHLGFDLEVSSVEPSIPALT
jgi:hypothetical protein